MVNNQYKLDEWLKIISHSHIAVAQFCYINPSQTPMQLIIFQHINTNPTSIHKTFTTV